MMSYNLCFNSYAMTDTLVGFMFWIIYVAASIMPWNYGLNNAQIQVLNAFLELESNGGKNQTIIKASSNLVPPTFVKFMKVLVCMIEFSALLLPILQMVLLTNRPCTPPFILSMLPCICRNKENSGVIVIRIMVHVFELLLGVNMYLSGSSAVVYPLFVGSTCLLSYLSKLNR